MKNNSVFLLIKNSAFILFLSSAIIRSELFISTITAWGLFAIISAVVANDPLPLHLSFYAITIFVLGIFFKIPLLIISICVALFLLTSLSSKLPFFNKHLIKIVFFGILLTFLINALIDNNELIQKINQDPELGTYRMDTITFLKTFYLMNKNVPYYEAFSTSYLGDFRHENPPADLWAYRFPTIFLIWKTFAFGNVNNIYIMFLVSVVLMLSTVYFIGKKVIFDSRLSLIFPYMLLPYFIYGATFHDPEFLHTGWWGLAPLFLMVFGIAANSFLITFFGGAITLIIRELFLLPIISLLIAAFILRRITIIKAIVASLIVFGLATVWHALNVFNRIPFTWSAVFKGRRHETTIEFIRQVLSNGSARYLFLDYRIFSLYALFGLFLGVVLIFWKPKVRHIAIFLISLYLPTLISFIWIGTCCWSDYWGILIDPLIILSSSLITVLFLKEILSDRLTKLKTKNA